MTDEDFKNLKPGDLVKHPFLEHPYVVTANLGNRVTAVRTVDLTTPAEWVKVDQPRRRKKPSKGPLL